MNYDCFLLLIASVQVLCVIHCSIQEIGQSTVSFQTETTRRGSLGMRLGNQRWAVLFHHKRCG